MGGHGIVFSKLVDMVDIFFVGFGPFDLKFGDWVWDGISYEENKSGFTYCFRKHLF